MCVICLRPFVCELAGRAHQQEGWAASKQPGLLLPPLPSLSTPIVTSPYDIVTIVIVTLPIGHPHFCSAHDMCHIHP